MGNPSIATTNVRNRDDFLIVKPFFVESYDSSKGEPNWVSWVVTAADVGDAPRKRTFDTEEEADRLVDLKGPQPVTLVVAMDSCSITSASTSSTRPVKVDFWRIAFTGRTDELTVE